MKLAEALSLYVSHKRALGYRFRTEEAILRSFCKTIGATVPIQTIESRAVLDFLNGNGPVTESWARKHRALTGLYKFSQARGLVEVSPLPHAIPKPTVPTFIPYIYSHEDLKHLMKAVPAACSGRVPIDEEVLKTLILLLYGAGLRIGEALTLTLDEVDLPQAYLRIRETKFFKSRLVPMGKDLTELMTEYVLKRQQHQTVSNETPLFCFIDGSPLSQSASRSAFRRLRSHAGVLREGGNRRQPRLHDLRHTAVVHRLIAWYRTGADLHELLPKLAIYLGHVDLSSTQRYLTLTPELLQQANLLFEHYAIGE